MKLMSVVRAVLLLCVTAVTVAFGSGTPRGSFEEPKEKPHYTSLEEQKPQMDAEKRQAEQARLDEQKRRDDEARRHAQQIEQRVQEMQKSEKAQQSAITLSDEVLNAAKILVDAEELYDKNDSDGGDKLVDSLMNNERLRNISYDDLKKLAAGSSWSLEKRFSIIVPLIDALLKRRALKGENVRYERVFVNYVDALLSSCTVDELRHLLEHDSFLLQDIGEKLGSAVREPPAGHKQWLPAEYLFYVMTAFIQKLIKALPAVTDDHWYDDANVVAQWIGEIPVEQPAMMTYMRTILKDRPVRFIIPEDYKSLRALMRIFKGYDKQYVDALKLSFLQAAHTENSLEALREALLLSQPLPVNPQDALLPLSLDVQQAYVQQMFVTKNLEKIATEDVVLMNDALHAIALFNKEYVSKDVMALLKNIPGAMRNLEVQAKTADSGKQKAILARIKLLSELFERAKEWYTPELRKAYLKNFGTVSGLKSMDVADPALIINTLSTTNPQDISEEISAMVKQMSAAIKALEAESKGSDLSKEIRDAQIARLARLQDLYVAFAEYLLPEHRLPADVWKNLITRVQARKQTFKPVIFDWQPAQLNRYLFNMDRAGHYDVGQALGQFVKVYNFYEQFPELQKILLSKLQALRSQPIDAKTKQAILASIALAPDVQAFLYKVTFPAALLGYTNIQSLRNDLLRFAHDQSLAGEYKYMLSLSPAFVELAGVYTDYFFDDDKSIRAFYDLLKLMSGQRFKQFVSDIDSQHYHAKDMGILFNAVSQLDAPRARALLDALKQYKKVFVATFGSSGFPLSDKMIQDADAQINARLKSSNQRQSVSTSTSSRSSVSVSDVAVKVS